MSQSPPARRRSLLALVVGFLALGGAILAAHFAPAEGYEINIYDSTPLTYWVPLAVALLASTYVSISARSTWAWLSGLICSAGGVLSVGALPLLRGYFFYGPADSLTHLGWVKDILAGRLPTLELLYPGLHTFSIAISRVTGMRLTRAMLFVVFSFLVLYIVFVPLTVWLLTDRRWLVTAAAYAGMFYLPMNQISMHYMSPHSFSQATQLLPMVVYVFVLYLVSRPSNIAVGEHRLTSIGVLFALTSIGAILYHPLFAVNALVLLGFGVVIQLVARRVTFSHRIIEHRSLLPQVGFFGVLTVVWTALHDRGSGTSTRVLGEVVGFLSGIVEPAAVVGQRTESAQAIGISPAMLFAKIFLVMAMFAALTGVLILIAGTGRLNADRSDTGAVTVYLSLGVAVLVPVSLMIFVGDSSGLFFRNLGVIMGVCTILGTLALAYIPAVIERSRRLRPLARRVRAAGSRFGRARTLVVVVLVLMLLTHSLAIMFTSPYMYRPSRGVSEQMMTGHQSLFEHQADGVSIAKPRGGPDRYLHGIYGTERAGDTYALRDNTIERLGDLQSEFTDPWYITISDSVTLREVVAYRELRFDRSNLTSIDTQIGVDRVQDNGELQTYLT